MFWSGNYIVVRELNFLLKEENVSLSQVLEADDILQECKADNKALIQFLTKPEILAELITLITEEPPKNVELASQYRHASIACEVLTSHLSMLSDRLSLDSVQMNRLCDFINKEPPLNPLLASYFSKTVEMLLDRSPKQDWYLYHIVCLRVLDFFKSRRDFLPNLLRHLATSAIADTFKYFIRLDDLFNKFVMEWLEEHQFLESMIQIICGTYVPEPLAPPADAPPPAPGPAEAAEKCDHEPSEKADSNHKGESQTDKDVAATEGSVKNTEKAGEAIPLSNHSAGSEQRQAVGERFGPSLRLGAVAAANAAGLLCELVLNGCAGDGCTTRPRTSCVLVSRLQGEPLVRCLLQGMFTAPPHARDVAVVHGTQLLRALLAHSPILGGEAEAERSNVELLVAPHLPLLHQALLLPPAGQRSQHQERGASPPPSEAAQGGDGAVGSEGSEGAAGAAGAAGRGGAVGAARVHVAALLAQLAASEVEEVAATMLTLGTPGVLVDMVFAFPHNNFLHAQVCALVRNALENRAYRTQYAQHLLVECDLLTRLMDAYEQNENAGSGVPRAAYMGHVVLMLRRVWRALEGDPALEHALQLPAADGRWRAFVADVLRPLAQRHDTPLGGYYPSENIYEVDNMAESMEGGYECSQFNDMVTAGLDELGDEIGTDDVNQVCGGSGGAGELTDGLDDDPDRLASAQNRFLEMAAHAKKSFLELADQRFDDDMWEDGPEPEHELPPGAPLDDSLGDVAPWEQAGEEGVSGGEGWAQFGADVFGQPADPFAPAAPPACAPAAPAAPADFDHEFTPYWSCAPDGQGVRADTSTEEIEQGMRDLRLEHGATAELANNLLTAMSGMTPAALANLVHDNMTLHPAGGEHSDADAKVHSDTDVHVDTNNANVSDSTNVCEANITDTTAAESTDSNAIDNSNTICDSTIGDSTTIDQSTTDSSTNDTSTTDSSTNDTSTTDSSTNDSSTTDADS